MEWIPVVAAIFLAGYVVVIYNRLVQYQVQVDNSWSQIEVELKRRCDLIPNLVETVKGVMQFEKETLTKVMEARNAAMSAKDVNTRVRAEGEISGLLGRLMAVWENYPDLKSNKNAAQLQEELTSTENRIGYARGHYNDIVANFNTIASQFPTNVLAKMFGSFAKRDFFKTPEADKEVPKVKL